MKLFIAVLLVALHIVNLNASNYIDIWGTSRQVDTLEYRSVGPGVTYTRFNLPEFPLSVYMLTVDLNNPHNLLETFQAHNHLGRTEAMTSAYTRLSREGHQAIAGVNGNFWIVSGQGEPAELLGVPHSGSIRNGKMLTDPNNWNRGHGEIGFVMLDEAKRMWIDDISFNGVVKIENAGEHPISQINRVRRENELVLFNSYLGNNQPTRADDSGIEVFIKPVSGESWAVNQDVRVEVTRIIRDRGGNLLEAGESVLSGQGNARTFLENLSVGSTLTVNMGITTLTDNQHPLVEQMITGNALVMKNGELTDRNHNEAYNRNLYPRTGIGSSEDGKTLYLIVIERSVSSVGASTETMSGILRASGAYNAASMDGGGSAQMMLSGEIVNRPSDGRERAVANGWFLFHNAPEDNEVVRIEFGDRRKEIPLYAMYKPLILGYNQYGVLIDTNVENFTMTCSEHIGFINQEGYFVATNIGTGTITVEYNGARVSRQVNVIAGEISFRLDSVLIDGHFEYPIEVLSTAGNETMNVSPQLLTWTVDDDEICIVENGVLRGLKNGTTVITGRIGSFENTMKVRVEIPESRVWIQDNLSAKSGWSLNATSQLSAVLSTNSLPENWDSGFGVDFTFRTVRAPFIRLTSQQPLFSLPDSIKIILNTGDISIDRANLNMRANNSRAIVGRTVSSFINNTDMEISFALNEFFDTEDIAIFPVYLDNIHFFLNAQTPNQSYTLAIKEIVLIYNSIPDAPSSIRLPQPVSFLVYPNPVTGGNLINIRLKDEQKQRLQVEIYTLSGKKVQANTLEAQGKTASFTLKNLPAGIYLMKIRNKEFVETVKLLVR